MGFWEDLTRPPVRARRPSITWKIIQIDGPVLDNIGLKVKYGVVISTDAMLAQTQTLLFCPLIDGLDDQGKLPIETLPWHVEVEQQPDESNRLARLPYGRVLMSTKIVLPITRNEVDADGRSRGWLSRESQIDAARKLKIWLPKFR